MTGMTHYIHLIIINAHQEYLSFKRRFPMKYNKKRKIIKREDIINHFNKLYPYELIIEYMDDNNDVEWIDFWFEGNFDVNEGDIKEILESNIRDTSYKIKVKKNKIYLKSKYDNRIITIVKRIWRKSK